MDGKMDMKRTCTGTGAPTHVGPVARRILTALSVLPDADRRHASGMIEDAIANRCEEKGAKRYVHEQGGIEYRLEARFQDGVPALCGQITLDGGATYIGEALISITGMPHAKMQSVLAKAKAGDLAVKDVVSFMPDDMRAITEGHIDPDRDKIWLQIAYDSQDKVRLWPVWTEVRTILGSSIPAMEQAT